ncbi:hypothetical protein [Desulfogranum japonicum]|uniref:hypothetical protein n=1 Tax=Desulfogranum japonicum TaxID=231447 RepID=UPI0003FA0878|nr:hypothetical protein [Desulfogranum japonicum]
MTLTQAQERLALYLEAERAVLTSPNQTYTVGNQTYTKHDLAPIQAEIRRLEATIAVLSRSGRLSHASAVFGGRR